MEKKKISSSTINSMGRKSFKLCSTSTSNYQTIFNQEINELNDVTERLKSLSKSELVRKYDSFNKNNILLNVK